MDHLDKQIVYFCHHVEKSARIALSVEIIFKLDFVISPESFDITHNICE